MAFIKPEITGPRPDIIIHLGAGRGQEIDEYLKMGAGKIVLVEADPEMARTLMRRTSDLSEVKVVQAAISSKDGKALLKVFNLKAFNSLRSPTVLQELFPGLRLLREIGVNALNPVAKSQVNPSLSVYATRLAEATINRYPLL